MKYCRPEVKDYGNLVAITADGAGMAHLGFGTLAAVSSPMLPASGGAGVAGDVASPTGGGDVGDVAGDAGAGPGVEPVAGTGSAADSDGSGGGNLPFTGLPAAAIGALGAGLSAAGLAVRKYLSRD